MGSDQPKAPKPTMEDALIQMKMQSKRMARQSAKAMKQSQQYMKKAKQALKKNNQQGAKLYLTSAASKRQQSMNIQRMGLKMQFIAGNMKNMQNNQQIMNSFGKMAQLVSYNTNPNFQMMSNNMANLEKCMDQMMINGKMMEQMMKQNDTGVDTTAQNMLDVLKGQIAMQAQNKINQAAMIQQQEMQFQQDLKKL